MKLNKIQFSFLCLILTGISSADLVHADSKAAIKSEPASTITNKHKSPNLKHPTVTAVNSHKRKEILVDDSRSLSAFFILGIIINIIMFTTFSWWFTKEWRSQKK